MLTSSRQPRTYLRPRRLHRDEVVPEADRVEHENRGSGLWSAVVESDDGWRWHASARAGADVVFGFTRDSYPVERVRAYDPHGRCVRDTLDDVEVIS